MSLDDDTIRNTTWEVFEKLILNKWIKGTNWRQHIKFKMNSIKLKKKTSNCIRKRRAKRRPYK
jgi:hypothetical protein